MIVQSDALSRALQTALTYLKDELEKANVDSFRLTIEASGRTQPSEGVKIEYQLRDNHYGASTEGNSLAPVMVEFLRRKGWNVRYAPTCLPVPTPQDLKEEIV